MSAVRIFRAADLARRQPLDFALTPEPAERAALADALGATEIRRLAFRGTLVPEGTGDWRLEARLSATVVQPCVVTLEPVTTRIDEIVVRRYLAHWDEPEAGSETEMPEDDTAEPIPSAIDPGAVMAEALALALPGFPRIEGVEIGELAAAPPGAAVLGRDAAHPFAVLGRLRERKD